MHAQFQPTPIVPYRAPMWTPPAYFGSDIPPTLDSPGSGRPLYEPPRYRGDCDRVRQAVKTAYEPYELREGQRVGHLVIMETHAVLYDRTYDHAVFRRAWGETPDDSLRRRPHCKSSYCTRCSPETAKAKTPGIAGHCVVQCDCGSENKRVGAWHLLHGQTLSCGRCSHTHMVSTEERERGAILMRMDCGCWHCTATRWRMGLDTFPVMAVDVPNWPALPSLNASDDGEAANAAA